MSKTAITGPWFQSTKDRLEETKELMKNRGKKDGLDPTLYEKEYQEKYCDRVSYNVTGTVRRYPNQITVRDKTLVIPCEDGRMVNRLRNNGYDAWGCDVSEFAINEAGKGTAWKKKIQPYIFLDNILDTKIEENSYDTIVCRYLGEHFEDDQIEIFLDNIHKITKRFVYFGITSIKSPHFYLDDTHVAEYDLKQWEEILTRNNRFEIYKRKPTSEEWLLKVIKDRPQVEEFIPNEDILPIGHHYLGDFQGIRKSDLNDEDFLKGLVEDSVVKASCKIINTASYKYFPYGISVVCLLEESHVSIHTYPEYGMCFIDIFTCGEEATPKIAMDHLQEVLAPTNVSVKEIIRGKNDRR